jgi:hypothetical protein
MWTPISSRQRSRHLGRTPIVSPSQEFRNARARRVKTVVAFSTETGRAAYEVLRQAVDEDEAARMSMGWGTDEMTNDQFERYLYDLNFESLTSIRQPIKR